MNFGDGIKKWASEVIDEVKKAFGIGTDASLMKNEVAKVLSAELGDGLMTNSKMAIKAFKSAKTELDYQKKLDLIDEQTYYENLEILRDKYFSKGSENWVKYTAEVYEYQKELLESETKNLTKIYDTVADYADEKFDEIRKKQEKLYKSMTNIGDIFKKNTVYMNGEVDVYYSTRDLKNDIENIKSYAETMTRLKELLKTAGLAPGHISGFLEEINSMGTEEGLSYMRYMLGSGEEHAISYAKLWAERESVSKTLSEELFSDDYKQAAEEVGRTLKDTLLAAGYEIPEGFFDSGTVSAKKFGEAFLSELDLQLADIRTKIMDFAGSLNVYGGAGDTVNTTNNYNITTTNGENAIDQIKRYDTIKRLSGV